MTLIVVWFLFSILALWLFVMFLIWKKQENKDVIKDINPVVEKTTRLVRRSWFLLLLGLNKLRLFITKIIAKIFFAIFPKAKTAFEPKNDLTGLEQGPSSYFLMSISEEKDKKNQALEIPKKTRRKIKNV